MTLESGSPRKAQPKSAELVRKLVNQRTPEATSDNQPAPKITTEDGNLVRLPADPEEMNALQESNRVEINSNPPSRAEQYADRQALGLPISDTPLTTKEISKALAAMKRERAPRTLMNIENTDQVAQALEQAARRINDSEKAIKAYETSGSRSLTREHTTDSTRKQNPRGEVLAFAERPTEIIQRKNSVDETPTEFSVTVTPEQAREGASDEAPTVFMERTGTQILDETVEQKDIQETLNRHLEAQAQNETNDRLLRMEQLALSLGLTLSEELTDAQIDAAVQSLTQGMDDEDDNKYIAEEKAKRLKRYLNNINPERQASADALSEVQQMLNENKRENEAQTEDPIVRRDELLRSLGLDGRQLVTANDVVYQVRKLNHQKNKLTPEIIQTQQEVNRQGRQLIDLLREYPVGDAEDSMAQDAYVETAEDRAKLSENRPKEESMVGYVSSIGSAERAAYDKENSVIEEEPAALQKAKNPSFTEHPTLVPFTENEEEPTSDQQPLTERYRALQEQIVEVRLQTEALQITATDLRKNHQKAKNSQSGLVASIRRLFAPRQKENSVSPDELKKNEELIAEAEEALLDQEKKLDTLIAQAENLAADLIKNFASKELQTETRSAERESRESTETEYIPVQLLEASELQKRYDESLDTLYQMAGKEKRPSKESWQREAARNAGLEEFIADSRFAHLLPAESTSRIVLSQLVTDALMNQYDNLKQEKFGHVAADERLKKLEEQLEKEGVDIEEPFVHNMLEKAFKQFYEETIQGRLDTEAQRLRDQSLIVSLNELALHRRQGLDAAGLQGRYQSTKQLDLQSAVDAGLLSQDEAKRFVAIDNDMARLQHQLYPNQQPPRKREALKDRFARRFATLDNPQETQEEQPPVLEKQNQESPQVREESIPIKEKSNVQDDKARKAIDRAARLKMFEQLPSLAEIGNAHGTWEYMLKNSDILNNIIASINEAVKDFNLEAPKKLKIENDELNIRGIFRDAGPDSRSIRRAIDDVHSKLNYFLGEDLTRKFQPQLENEILEIYNLMAQRETIAGDTLSDPAQLDAWQNAIKNDEFIDERISTLAKLMPKVSLGNNPKYIRDQLLEEASPAQIMRIEERLKKMIQYTPDSNSKDAEKELANFMRAVNYAYKQASSPDTRMAA